MKSNPCLPQLEKARTQQQRPNTAKKKKGYYTHIGEGEKGGFNCMAMVETQKI